MDIRIELFDFPTKEDMLPLLSQSPLSGYQLKMESFLRSDLYPMEQMDYEIKLGEIISNLNSRVFQVNLSYAYVLYYFNRGIPDEEWMVTNEGGKTQFLPHLNNEHWTNKIHFEHHTDSMFQKAFTTLDLFAHVLFERFDLERNIRNGREEDISFNRAIWKLKERESELHEKLKQIKDSTKFKEATQNRNDIIHNQPPYIVHTRYEKQNNVTYVRTYYITSKKLKESMYGLLECMKEVFESVKIYGET